MILVWTEAPDFERLPAGTREQYERRLTRLPLHRIRIRIDFDAVLRNECRFNERFCTEHGLSGNDNYALATWHLDAVNERLQAARPDLKPHRQPRLPRGLYLGPEHVDSNGHTTGVRTIYRRNPGTRLDRLAWTFRRLTPNFMVGWPCWFGNRWSSVRGVWVGHRAAQFRRTQGS